MSKSRRSVVFIDANITDLSHLISGIKPGVAVSVLTDDANGVDQITAYLSEHPADIVHIVSHGAPGTLHLGNGELNLENLSRYASALATWFNQSESPSLLLYGCNVAAGDAGSEFVEKIHSLTGAAIAASSTLTGSSALGGDWNLGVKVGRVEAELAFQAATQNDYGFTLAATIDTTTSWNGTNSITTFGEGATSTYGQVFTVPGGESSLTSFTFYIDDFSAAPVKFVAYVMAWNGSSATGSVLYQSAVRTTTGASSFEEFTFNTGGVNLTPGAQYIAFATVGGATDGVGDSARWGSISNSGTYSGGDFVYSDATSVSGFTSSPWFGFGGFGDSAFKMQFGPVNAAPTLDLNGAAAGTGFTASFTEGGAAAAVVDSSNLTLTDDGSTITSATVTLTNRPNGTAESLAANVGATGITASYDSSTGVLSLTGASSVANYQQVLRTITYNNTSENPNTTARTINFVVNDGNANSTTVTSTVSVTAVNDSPTGGVTITGNPAQGQTLTASNTLADLDGLGAITYAWFADGSSTGRTGATYLLGQADVGKIFTVVASYTDSGTTAESVTSAPTASIAPAVTVSGLDSFTFTEGSGPIIIDNNVSFTSFVNYNDGSLRFKLTNGTTADQLGLTSSATPNAVGAISIDGRDVYLGNGTGRDRIGSIDATLDGTNGKDLLINFASPLTNSGFETGNLTGWTAFNQNYSTINNLNGQSIPYVFANGTITGTGTIILGSSPSVTFSSQVQTTTVSSGTYALRLFSNGGISGPSGSDRPTGNGSVHGSYVRSSTFNAFAGDSITLDWAAQNGSDAYEVFGFLVGAGGDNTFGTGDDTRTRLFAQRGDVQAFTEASAVISSTGAYQFEFVCGTYDKTGGLALGASLYVDNVRLVSSTSVTSAVVSTIAQQVTYNNTSTAPITTPRTLEVTATNANGESGSATSSGTVVGVNNSPTGDVTISGTAAQGQTLTAANTLVDGDGLGAITYTWFADGIDTGKTGTTYTLGQADVGKVFTVRASYTDNGGTNEAVTSVGTSAVTDENVAPTGGVTISGTVAQGQTLTASNTLADADGLGELSYEWEQSLDGNTWTTISGATASTFTLTQDQVNQFVRAKVSYTDGDGNAESVASTATTNKVTNENDAPTGAVTVNGVLKEGYVLTADTSTLADLDGLGALSYQWERSSDGGTTWTTIPEATDSSFTLGKSEVGQTLRVKVSYTDNLGGLEQLTSAATAESVAVFKPNSDFDGDGYADIFWRNTALESAVVWLMQDINPQGAVSILPNIDGGWEIRAVADFDGNGGPDVLWQNSLSSETVFWLFDGLTPTTAVNLFEPGLAWEVADAGDFNGDGKADIIWRNVVTGENALWFMDGTQAIGAGSLPTIPDTEWEISAVGDLSRDGKTDIIWRHGLDGDTVVWTMDGATPVEAITIAEVPTNWALHGAVSLSGDTQLDLLWHNQDSGEVVMWDMKGLDVNGAVSLAFVPSNWEATL